MRILIVDDDLIIRELLLGVLQEAGHEVISASSGEEALALLHHHEVQVIISDWQMPGISGLDLCREVRERLSVGYVYIILLTSWASNVSCIEALDTGADDFMNKPFETGELLARLRVANRVLALESRDVTIYALAKLAESRDPETGAHIERVSEYSTALALELQRRGQHAEIDAGFVRMLHETAPLHDIGKVAIPDAVLLKPGKLTPCEKAVMQQHAMIGAQTLRAAATVRPNARFLRVAADIAAAHHERWDGTGYPLGLAGEEIPLVARIVAVADVYDALTTTRPYKQAFTHERARAIIRADRGTHFDPAVVDAFLAIEDQFIEIARRYADHVPVPPVAA